MKTLKIKDFIQGRSVSYQTIRKYITNHPELFAGHIGKKNNIELDDVAIDLLEQKYPLSKPVELIEDTENLKKLMQAQELIIHLQKELNEKTEQLLESKKHEYLLEAKYEQVKELAIKADSLKNENANLKMNIEALERKNEREYDEFEEYKDRQRKKVERLENALEHEKNKTWWDKLRGR